MRKLRTTYFYLIGFALSILIIGCEDPDITKNTEQQEDQEWFSVVDEWNENAELSDEEETILRDRIETALRIREEGMPEEITQAWDKMKEDYKDFLGVEELPKREIAPGSNSWIPEEYLEGEKQKELYEFMSDKFKNLKQLYHKYGLRESVKSSKMPPGDFDYDTFVSVNATGSNQVQWGLDVWTFSDDYSSPPPYFMSQSGELTKGGTPFDTYDQSDYYTYTLGVCRTFRL